MTLAEMLAEVRDKLDEATAAKWSDADLTRYINHAQNKIQRIIVGLHRDHFVKSATINMVANTSEYAVPTDFLEVQRMEWINGTTSLKNPPRINQMAWDDIDQNIDLTATGNPEWYYFAGGYFSFRPVPSTTVTAGVRLWYVYRLADLSGAVTSEIPVEGHMAVVLAAAIEATLKSGEDANALQQQLNDEVGWMTQSLAIRQNQEPDRVQDTWGF